ncbi:RNA exonuclease 4 [Chelmon rostratus]|uniref:RNA exonuclease 4 n=1 Tax=Chelmon rostratus TaxID=109905 RepID=UPI001BE63A6B|nr:RNA exonuclease 4 [Chelmon rostratus]
MSKVKAKKTDSPAKTRRPKSTEQNNTAKQKRKQWMKQKYRKKKPPPKDQKKAKAQHTLPPKDAQQFSANWKLFQETLKASQPEKKQPVAPKHQNGALQKKGAKENSAKNISKNSVGPRETDAGKKVKHKTVPNRAVHRDSQVNSKAPGVSETKQPAAPKRKNDSERPNVKRAAKKKKCVVEEMKPTEADLWFDDVDPDDIEAAMGPEAAEIMRKKQGIHKNKDTEKALVKENAFDGLTRAVAIDCEMVGVGPTGEDSIVARVSLVNQFGKCIYDKHVKPTEKVTDYRTAFSGVRPEDIKNGEDVAIVQREVAEILQGRIVVGHAIHNDLKILLLDHPRKYIRDTQKYKPFKEAVKSGRPSLKLLCKKILNVDVQQGEHSSVQDAQATMRLYTLVKKQWESQIKAKQKNKASD